MAQNLGPKKWTLPDLLNDLFNMDNTSVWYRDSGRRYQKEGSLNLYHIESVDKDADELKVKFWAPWNNNSSWAA